MSNSMLGIGFDGESIASCGYCGRRPGSRGPGCRFCSSPHDWGGGGHTWEDAPLFPSSYRVAPSIDTAEQSRKQAALARAIQEIHEQFKKEKQK